MQKLMQTICTRQANRWDYWRSWVGHVDCVLIVLYISGSDASDIICLKCNHYNVFRKLFEFKSSNKLNPSQSHILTVL